MQRYYFSIEDGEKKFVGPPGSFYNTRGWVGHEGDNMVEVLIPPLWDVGGKMVEVYLHLIMLVL